MPCLSFLNVPELLAHLSFSGSQLVRHLSFDELLTVLSEVEANLNSRPLMYDNDTQSEDVLTPAHLIYRRRLTSLPESPELKDNIGYTRRYRYVNERLQHFTKEVVQRVFNRFERVAIVRLKGPWRSLLR